MDIDEFVGFTARERYVLNAYRDRELSSRSRYIVFELTYVIPALLFVSSYFWYRDVTWLFVGFAVLLSRIWVRGEQTLLFLESYRAIVLKYEAKVKELMALQQERE